MSTSMMIMDEAVHSIKQTLLSLSLSLAGR